MSYSPTNWTDGTTPVDASNLNKIEDALVDQDSRIDANTDLIDNLGASKIQFGSLVTTISSGETRTYTITFPEAFNKTPIVVVTLNRGSYSADYVNYGTTSIVVSNVSTTSADVTICSLNGPTGGMNTNWIAVA